MKDQNEHTRHNERDDAIDAKMKLTRFEDLDCWQEARIISNRVYDACAGPEFKKDYSLTDQTKRAAVSIMANIAEGFSRKGDKEFIQFLYVALGSNAELETHVLLSERLGYISGGNDTSLKIVKIRQMLLGLIRSLKAKG